jgi:MEMO1 family protein
MGRRLPAVAGQFYSAAPQALRAEVESCQDPSATPKVLTIAISPHAGLMYSGHVAGAVYSRLTVPDTVILIGPNHTGHGPVLSVCPEGSWLIPGNELLIDRSLAAEILNRVPPAEADESAHRFEHCLEVQLPFLAHNRQDVQIVPIVLGTTNPELCRDFGRALAHLIRELARGAEPSRRPLILATTDMSHYEPDTVAREKDAKAIQAIRHLDPELLYTQVRTHNISMCGLGPTLVALEAARELQADDASLVRYATSGDVTGDHDRVVGYAGFVIDERAGTA